MKDFAFNVWEA
jgi:hypothetical protein